MHTMTKYGLLDEAPQGVPRPVAEAFRHQRAILEATLDQWQRGIEAIKADPLLSSAGKQGRFTVLTQSAGVALEAAVASALPGVGTVADWRTGTAARLARIEEARALPEVHPVREDEIRRALMALSPSERFALAQEAAQADDRETLRAILNAPRVAPVLDAQALAQLDDIHRAAVTPAELLQELTMRQRVEEQLEHNIFQARRTLRGEGRVALPMEAAAPGVE
jgi:hypothetical protein